MVESPASRDVIEKDVSCRMGKVMENIDAILDKSLWLEGVVQVEENIAYASCSEFNALFKVDLSNGDCTYLALFPYENANGKRLYIKAIYVKNKIYFIPATASTINVYNLETNSFESIFIKKEYVKKQNFADAYVYGEYIYILPAMYPAIIKLNYIDNTVEYLTDNIPIGNFYFRPGTAQVGNKLFIPNTKDNLVLEFDMEKEMTKLHYVGKQNNGSWSMVEDGGFLWLIPKQHGAFVKWDYENDKVYEYDKYPEGYKESDFCFTKGYKSGDYIFALPAKANMFMKLNNTGEIKREEFLSLKRNDIVMYNFELAGFIYIYVYNENDVEKKRIFLRLKLEDGTVQNWNFRLRYKIDNYVRDYFKERVDCNGICKENSVCNLSSYQEKIVKGSLLEKGVEQKNQYIGKMIYQRIL